MFSPVIDELINALRCLPGVGPKSAQRMALHLLERDRSGGARLVQALDQALERVGRCSVCRNLTEQHTCSICTSPRRDVHAVCVVETPADVIAIEQTRAFNGRYFVLLGHLSPIDGIGPDQLGIDQLLERLREGEVTEVILATNLTVEGEATAHFIGERARALGVTVSRIAHGVPMGGELEYVDGGTLMHALNSRKQF